MTVESKIYDLLSPLAGNRVFPDVAPIKTERPYITYQQIGGNAISTLDRVVMNKQHGMFQVNVYADTRAAAAALAMQVEDAFKLATTFQASPIAAPIANHDAELNRYGTSQDFSIWSDR